ncbi:MAG: copper resistance protein CopC [Alphaproteobacteria bacterium]|nr:copper resistance protein CopC [Alphaproteobacteria bacterium]MBV9551418.1 copper resistance protein CopC [Alphaproteobacteria bacterium]
MKRMLLPIALTAVLPAPTAFPHAFLDHAVPAVGSTVAGAPTQVELYYTQALEPAFSEAALTGPDGQAITTARASVDPQNPMELVLKLPALSPGHYKVKWHVVSVDTHRTEGSFSFDVQ